MQAIKQRKVFICLFPLYTMTAAPILFAACAASLHSFNVQMRSGHDAGSC
jgi:hypothetical protein